MPKIKKDDFIKLPTQDRIFNEDELQKFHNELALFKITRKLDNGESVTYLDSVAYHIHKGTMTDRFTAVIEVDTFGEVIIPSRYERLENKFRQYKFWLARKEHSKRIIELELDKVTETLEVKIHPIF